MSGISVPQYEVFKLGTSKLKYAGWNLTISKDEAFKYGELVSLFESQMFRILANNIIGKKLYRIKWEEVVLEVVIDKKSDFKRATSSEGVIVNGEKFELVTATSGGIKLNTLIFVNSKYVTKLKECFEAGRPKDYKMIPAKCNAYISLSCSASQPIVFPTSPKNILVVHDCVTHYSSDVIELQDTPNGEPKRTYVSAKALENNTSDGLNLCSHEYMERAGESLGLSYIPVGLCLRCAWTKGMVYEFPIAEFADKYGIDEVEDVWGEKHKLRDVELILTESSLKIWNAYTSISDYISKVKKAGYTFATTKIIAPEVDEYRELNYQYLQSYKLSQKDLEELCNPTIEWLKKSMGSDYDSVKEFLGLRDSRHIYSWMDCLAVDENFLKDPYVINSIHSMIKRKIDDAKIGKLRVRGHYSQASGDMFALMQSICNLEVTGILKEDEIYSPYWDRNGVDEVCVYRSPMTSHNNIRKMKVCHSEEARKWFGTRDGILVVNAFSDLCMAENGADFDGDSFYSTDNRVLLDNYKPLPPIDCIQGKAEKIIVTEQSVKDSDLNGMGNSVGVITNRVTSMMEVQSRFVEGSKEWDVLQYRIECGQLQQQGEIDKIKGIKTEPMPLHWYRKKACKKDPFLEAICSDVKPLFMRFIYPELNKRYTSYIKTNRAKCLSLFGMSLDELLALENLTDEQKEFKYWYYRKMPVGLGNCTMNRICEYVSKEMDGYKSKLVAESDFDWRSYLVPRRCTEEHRNQLRELQDYYLDCVVEAKKKATSNKEEALKANRQRTRYFRNKAKELVPNNEERLNIAFEIAYAEKGSRAFAWDIAGDVIAKRFIEKGDGEHDCSQREDFCRESYYDEEETD